MKARDWLLATTRVLMVAVGVVCFLVFCGGIAWGIRIVTYDAGFKDGQKSSCQELVDDAFRSGKAMGLKNGGRK